MAQVASKVLGIPIEKIRIKPTDSMLCPNGVWTGASITSELNCLVSLCVYTYVYMRVLCIYA